jgi:hypothetical protein
VRRLCAVSRRRPKGVDELLLRGFKILGQLADQRCSASIQVLPQSH